MLPPGLRLQSSACIRQRGVAVASVVMFLACAAWAFDSLAVLSAPRGGALKRGASVPAGRHACCTRAKHHGPRQPVQLQHCTNGYAAPALVDAAAFCVASLLTQAAEICWRCCWCRQCHLGPASESGVAVPLLAFMRCDCLCHCFFSLDGEWPHHHNTATPALAGPLLSPFPLLALSPPPIHNSSTSL